LGNERLEEMKKSDKLKTGIVLSEDEARELQHAVKVAKFKRIPFTLGNVFGQCEPVLRKKLMEYFRFQLHMTFRELIVEDPRKPEEKEKTP